MDFNMMFYSFVIGRDLSGYLIGSHYLSEKIRTNKYGNTKNQIFE